MHLENSKSRLSLTQLRKDLIDEEGYKKNPYFDHLGYVSFGIGRNLVTNPLTESERRYGARVGFYTESFVEHLFENDLNSILADLDTSFPWWRDQPENVQRGLAQMRFQLGPGGFRSFVVSLPLIRHGRYFEAAKHMRMSKWATKDTPARASRVIELIEGDDA